MCDLCKNNIPRTYTHSRSRTHLKLLIAKFKEHKLNNFKKYK